MHIHCLTYHDVSIRKVRVDAITDVSNAATALLRRTLLSDEEQQLKQMMQMMQKRHAKANNAQLQTKQGIKRSMKTKTREAKPKYSKNVLAEEEEDQGPAEEEEDQDDAEGDVRAHIQRHAANDAVDGDMPIMVDVSDVESKSGRTGADLAPIFEVRDSKISKRLSRLSVMRYGRPSETWSMYCYMHGCNLCFKATSMPTNENMLDWVKARQEYNTRSPANKQRHEEARRELFRARA